MEKAVGKLGMVLLSFKDVVVVGINKVVAKYSSLKWYMKAVVVYTLLLSLVNWWALSTFGVAGFLGGLLQIAIVVTSLFALLGIYTPKDMEAPAAFFTLNFLMGFWSLFKVSPILSLAQAILSIFLVALYRAKEEQKRKADLEDDDGLNF